MKSRIVLLLLGLSLFVWSMSTAAEEQKKVELLPCATRVDHWTTNWGFCDRASGELMIKKKFKAVSYFSEELAVVDIVVGKYKEEVDRFVIDTTGNKAFDIPDGIWIATSGFSEGLARIEKDGKFGYMDKTGKIVIEPKFENAQESFKEGFAFVKELVHIKGTEFAARYGWIDKTGKVIIKPRFDRVQEFRDGLAMVSYTNGTNVIIGFIDKTGKEIIRLGKDVWDPFNYDPGNDYAGYREAFGFSDGLAWVQGKRGKYYAINNRGRIVFKDIDAVRVSRFSEGLSAIQLRVETVDKMWAYIDKTGKIAIKPIECETAYPFSEGMARIHKMRGSNFSYEFINKQGKVIKVPNNDYDFSGGIARVNTPTGVNYIDKTGKYLWELTE